MVLIYHIKTKSQEKKNNRRQAAANVPQRGVAPFPLVGLDRTLKKIRRQAESNPTSRLSGESRTTGATPEAQFRQPPPLQSAR